MVSRCSLCGLSYELYVLSGHGEAMGMAKRSMCGPNNTNRSEK